MRFLKKLFGSEKPMVIPEPQDRFTDEVSYDLTPDRISSIMVAANSGNVLDQVRLADEILEKNADVIQAFNTRRDAVMGLPWHIEHEDQKLAGKLEDMLRSCGDGDEADSFEDMLQDMLGAILPGFAVSEILWQAGGNLAGFRHIPQRNFTFVDSLTPKLVTADEPQGVVLPRQRIIYHKRRFHGSDPARGGLIRPLAWLHCFKHVGEKDLLSFVERHGMPFVAAKVDPTSFDKEKNLIKKLVRSFGSSGGGVFTKAVELELLESHSTGDVYFRLLDYIASAVNKVILGQTASSGDASGWSKGDAQSQVRQDILEADCRILQRLIDTQLLKPYMAYNYGADHALPHFVIDSSPPEDKEKIAGVVKILHDAGFETDIEQISSLVGLKLKCKGQAENLPDTIDVDTAHNLNLKQKYDAMGVAIRAGLLTATPEIEAQTRQELNLPPMSVEVRKSWDATGGIRQPITLKTAESAAVAEALDVESSALAAEGKPAPADTAAFAAEPPPPAELTQWLGPVAEALSDVSDPSELSGLSDKFGSSAAFEETFAQKMLQAYNEGGASGNQDQD